MNWLYQTLFVSNSGIIIGAVLIYLAIAALVWMVCTSRMGEDPHIPTPDTPTVEIRPALPAAANWTSDLFVWETTEMPAVIDCTDTVEITPVDPLAVTTEIERVDPGTPLFYSIKRPKRFELESFTREWSRDQVNRAIEAGRPQ